MNQERTLGHLETQDSSGATEWPFGDGDFSFPSATANNHGCHPQWPGCLGELGAPRLAEGSPGTSWPSGLSPSCHFSGSRVLGAELCICSQSQEHLSCLCFSRCCFLGSTGVESVQRWEPEPFLGEGPFSSRENPPLSPPQLGSAGLSS